MDAAPGGNVPELGYYLAERAWETVDQLAPDEDAESGADYRTLTQQLKAVGQDTSTPPFGSSPEARPGRFAHPLHPTCL